MGCVFDKLRSNDSTSGFSKEYSWDRRVDVDVKNYILEEITEGEKWKLPGSINGQQFVIRNCRNASIFIFDYMDTVTIDDCKNCKIIMGPVKGSVFLRDCKECVCVVACGQFRTRDCRKLDIFLCCATQPIIESSTSMHFGCYQLYYEGIEGQFCDAGLSVFNNEWSSIHDFTPFDGDVNWCLLPDTIRIEDYVSLPVSDELRNLNMSLRAEKSTVPHTWGPHKVPVGQVCLVSFFCDDQQLQRPDCLLRLSKQRWLTARDAETIFKTSLYTNAVQCGPVIGLQYCGPGCIGSCLEVSKIISSVGRDIDMIYVSTNALRSSQECQSFFNSSYTTVCVP
ncbi:protein XRP2 isoform X2 [Anabrus simplex]|uniref:protein XRP2 isoform X2 n=1 Tax=Anabrus simplex TaxID=316456 RepID=UPI0035A351D8